jgi:hypothetical protein
VYDIGLESYHCSTKSEQARNVGNGLDAANHRHFVGRPSMNARSHEEFRELDVGSFD